MWAIVVDGRILSTYHRKQSAHLNAKGRVVEEISNDDPRLRVPPPPIEPEDYAAARRLEYAKIDLGEQLEMVTEGLIALLSGEPVPQSTLDKMEALAGRVGAIKAEHPKP